MTEDNKQKYNVSVDSIKTALRIDGDQDNLMIQAYIDTAKDYINDAIDSDIELNNDNKYNLAVLLLVQFWYSNRTTDMKKTPYQVRSLIQQLRGEYWDR